MTVPPSRQPGCFLFGRVPWPSAPLIPHRGNRTLRPLYYYWQKAGIKAVWLIDIQAYDTCTIREKIYGM